MKPSDLTPNLNNLKPDLLSVKNNQSQIKDIQENIVSLTQKINYQEDKNFLENIESAIQDISNNQIKSAEITKNFELGIEKVWKNLQEEHKLIYDRVYSEAKKKLICNTCSRATFKMKEDQASTITGNQNTVLSTFNS